MKNNDDWLAKLIAGTAVLAIFCVAYFGILSLFWLLWGWVLPQIWPTGPAVIVRPAIGYLWQRGSWCPLFPG